MEKEKKLTGYASIDRPWLKYYEDGIYDIDSITEVTPKLNMYQNLVESNKSYKKQNILKYFNRDITINEVFDNVDAVSRSLKEMGIRRGDIVTLCMPTIPETIYTFYALNRIGAIANMVDPRTSAEGIKDYVKETNSKHIFTLDSFSKKIASFADDKSLDIKKVITVSPADSLPLGLQLGYSAKEYYNRIKNKDEKIKNDKFINWGKFIKMGKNYTGVLDEKYIEDFPALIVHTGGTTGNPKGVVLSNEAFNTMPIQYKTLNMGLERDGKYLNVMPPFIAYGVFGFHLTMCLGVDNILIPALNSDELATLILKYQPTIYMGVPAHYEKLILSDKIKNKDLSFLRLLASGGDHMKPELEERINSFLRAHNCDYKVTEGYGMTELSASACTNTHNHNISGSVGIPLCKNIIAAFEPGTTKELKYGETGEICVTGPTIMLEYYENKEETDKVKKVHPDGKTWIHTGDLGYVDSDGFVYIFDRIKRMIIRNDGFKVFPSLIENVIMSHPAVISCAVVGTPDPDFVQGKLPRVYIKLKDGYNKQNILDEIVKICRERLPEYAQPFKIDFIDELPLTPIGKVDFKTLELYNPDDRKFVDDSREKGYCKQYVK